MSARLHVLLGAGGVGKTTLAAGYALALARSGKRTGLLGIDPSRRLQGALGIELPDLDVPVPGAGELRAAILRPELAMRRWAAETCPGSAARETLMRNAFFLAVADRLASATDLLAAVRVAEWAERDPELSDLVVDTAPGLDAIEFLRRPQRLTAFLEGRLVAWLRRLSAADRHGPLREALPFRSELSPRSSVRTVRGSARRVLVGLARIGGMQLLLELADFVALAHDLFEQMLARVERMQAWLASPTTEIVLVTAVRDDADRGARQLADALASLGMRPSAIVLNRAVAPELAVECAALDAARPAARALLQYARSYASIQARLCESMRPLAPRLVRVRAARGLDETGRIGALAALGEQLLEGLTSRAS